VNGRGATKRADLLVTNKSAGVVLQTRDTARVSSGYSSRQ